MLNKHLYPVPLNPIEWCLCAIRNLVGWKWWIWPGTRRQALRLSIIITSFPGGWSSMLIRLGLTCKTVTIGHGAVAKFSNGWVQTLYFVLSWYAALKEADRQTEAVHLLEQLAENAVRQNRLEETGVASLYRPHPPTPAGMWDMWLWNGVTQEPFSQKSHSQGISKWVARTQFTVKFLVTYNVFC